MRPLVIAFMVLIAVAYSNMALIDSAESQGFVGNPVDVPASANKQEMNVENSEENFNNFLEEKLMLQSQALEHLITVADRSGDLINKLIQNLSKGLEKPKMPTKAEPEELDIPHGNAGKTAHRTLKFGKHIPKIGKLASDLMLKDHSGTDPTPLIEKNHNGQLSTLGTRRSYGSDPLSGPITNTQSDDVKVNPWCPMALLCQKDDEPVCGFDDEFGYGKFENFCHLLRVNCYWKYNFAVVYSCRPKL